HVENVRQLARECRGGHRVVVGGLRELLDDDLPVRLRGVEVVDDPREDVALNFVAGAVVPEAQLGLRRRRAGEAGGREQAGGDPRNYGHGLPPGVAYLVVNAGPGITEARQRSSPLMTMRVPTGTVSPPRSSFSITRAAASPMRA